jgi:hypothetical protein
MATDTAVPFWDEAESITCHASDAVTGKRFVMLSGARVDGNPRVNHAAQTTNGKKPFGVSGYTVADEAKVTVYTKPGLVMPVNCVVALTAGDDVYSDATGKATNVSPGAGARPAGTAVDDALINTDAPIKLA